jgi:hypothetical protein
MWFPAALVVLVLLAIPGALLFLLNLLGSEAPVNRWLRERFRLTYHIALPWWAALALLLVPLAIVLLYFLKLKRKPLQVPSTFLWRKSIEDLHVNALFQWLRDNVLLLLQVLTVLALIYAIMAFQFHGSTTAGQHYIILIDNSASMSRATDVPPNRLDEAKQQALHEIHAHSDNDVGMVIQFSSEATTLQSYTNDRSLLRKAVRDIEPTNRPTRFKEALDLADGLANPHGSAENEASRPENEEPGKERTYVTPEGIPTQVHLFSDGRFPDVPDFALGNLSLHFHPIGQPGMENVDNVGLTGLSATRDEKDPTKLQVLANVRNYRTSEVLVKVRLRVWVNDTFLGSFERVAQPQGVEVPDPQQARLAGRVMLPPEGNKENGDDKPRDRPGEGLAAFDLADVDDRASIILDADLPDIKDKFPLDNEAWLVVGVVRKAEVLVVGTPNKVLHAFFDHPATTKVANVTYLSDPADLKSEDKYLRPARSGQYDLVVFDRCAPEKEADLPLANTFFIDAVPPPWKKDGLEKLKNPHIKGWLNDDPLLRYLTALYDIGIDEAFRFELDPRKDPRVPPRTPRLLETDKDAAVMFSLSREPYRDLVMTFPLVDDTGAWLTNWPLQPSFPLFLRNVLYVLGHVSDAAGEEPVQPGQVKTLRPDPSVRQLEVVPPPPGQPEVLQRGSRPDFSYGKTEEVGVYQVKWDGGGQRYFSVNLRDADESNIEPRAEFDVGGTKVVAGEAPSQPRDTWKWVALAALALLLLEWLVYNRRIFV